MSSQKSYIVGLTGGIGSGKSAVSKLFEELNITVVDADIVAREVVAVGTDTLNCISDYFGPDILSPDKSLNRAKLREIIFNDEAKKLWLNNLLHPKIRSEITNQLSNSHSAYTVLVAPLLFENGLQKFCDRTLLVDVPIEMQIERTISRDKVDVNQVKNIISAQMPREDKQKLADDIIDNSTSLENTKKQVLELHQQYLSHIQ